MGKEQKLWKAFYYVFRQFSGESYYLFNCNMVCLQHGWVHSTHSSGKNLKFEHLTFITRNWIFFFLVSTWFPSSASINEKGRKKVACCSHLPTKNVRAMNFHTTGEDVAFCESSFPSSAHCWAGLILLLRQNKMKTKHIRWLSTAFFLK